MSEAGGKEKGLLAVMDGAVWNDCIIRTTEQSSYYTKAFRVADDIVDFFCLFYGYHSEYE